MNRATLGAAVGAWLQRHPSISDIHFVESGAVCVRGPTGAMQGIDELEAQPQWFTDLSGHNDVAQLRVALLAAGGALDESWQWGEHRFRWHLCLAQGQREIKAVMRRVRGDIPGFDELLLPTALKPWIDAPHGLILVCGSTNTGKTTSLAAMVDHYNRTNAGHIVTVEDPVEFHHGARRCLVTHRQVGRDCDSFARGLRDALRQDPNLLVVGEIRDRDTMATAMSAAEAGLLVLGTLHAGSAGRAVERVIDFARDDDKALWRSQLAHNLVGILVQVLLPRSDDLGRVLVTEAMGRTSLTSALIASAQTAKIEETLRLHADETQCLWSLNMSLHALVTSGLIEPQTALRASHSRKDLARMLRIDDTMDAP
jgi:pilus retraction protein PilT